MPPRPGRGRQAASSPRVRPMPNTQHRPSTAICITRLCARSGTPGRYASKADTDRPEDAPAGILRITRPVLSKRSPAGRRHGRPTRCCSCALGTPPFRAQDEHNGRKHRFRHISLLPARIRSFSLNELSSVRTRRYPVPEGRIRVARRRPRALGGDTRRAALLRLRCRRRRCRRSRAAGASTVRPGRRTP